MNDAEFTDIDGRLFDRLHLGSLDPITFRLKDGRRLTGQLLAVHRFGVTGEVVGPLGGEICLAVETGATCLPYGQIDHIE